MEKIAEGFLKSGASVFIATVISLIVWGFSVESRLEQHQVVLNKGEYMLRSEGAELIKQINALALEQASTSAKLEAVLESVNRNKRLTEQLLISTNRLNEQLQYNYQKRTPTPIPE